MMEKAGFIDQLGRDNVCPHIEASLARARELLGLPPKGDPRPPQDRAATAPEPERPKRDGTRLAA
jgi:SulP family sulfate permease